MPEEVAPRPAILIKPLPIVFGLLAGLGAAVLLQQYAVTLLTLPLLIGMGLAGALLIGIGLPTLLLHTLASRAVDDIEKEAPK